MFILIFCRANECRAWIRNATVKDNIVFSQPFDAALYRDVIRVCALTEDLRILPGMRSSSPGGIHSKDSELIVTPTLQRET
jgi:hypothetical protein